MTDKVRGNIKSVSIHVIIWTLVLMINFIFLTNYVFNFDLKFHILSWIVYIVIFYTLYSFLIPYFLLKKKIMTFTLGSLILLSGGFLINQAIARNQFITVFKQKNGEQGANKFSPDPFKPMPHDFKGPPPGFDREVLKRNDLEMRLRNGKPVRPGHDLGRLIFPMSGLLLLFFASISAKVFLRLRDNEKKRDELEKARISTELIYLKQQINPHFLFNTLNNLYALSIRNPELTPTAILKVSSILRHTLYNTDNSPVPLQEEIEIINAYIDVQKMRSKNNLPIEYHLAGDIGSHKIEPFILLPLVENAFKYGMADLNNSYIRIQITINSGNLQFYVENKKSFVAKPDPEHSGIGLKNIKRRLDLVYPDHHVFKIDDRDESFAVMVELPLEN